MKVQVYFNIIGEGSEKQKLTMLVEKYNLKNYVSFAGFKTGDELDNEFNNSDIGLSSLGAHRIQIYEASPLKSREYWARGLPIIKSYKDIVMDEKIPDYCMTITQDDSPVKIEEVVRFYNKAIKNNNIGNKLRDTAKENISWDIQLASVIHAMKEGKQ